VATASLFLLAPFFAPLVAGIGGGVPGPAGVYFYPVTAPIVILVGCFMMAPLAAIAWRDLTEAIPAFLCLTVMPFTFNIAHGIAAGVVAYVLVKAGAGRRREVSWLMWLLAAVIVVSYVALPRLRH
jgi:AGZA family xanthine/uracil permease-like MFS transporter